MPFLIVPVTPFEQNSSILWCKKTRQAVVVDPGGNLERILSALESEGLQLVKVLLTHGHIDHAGAAADLAESLGVPIEGPGEEDLFWIEGMPQQSRVYGFPPARAFIPQRWLKDGDKVCFGEVELEVIHCPGHTPGHMVFFNRQENLLIVGDVLFQGSIGRTDFPKGNYDTLINSIKGKLFPLGDEVDFIPGHGPMSTIGEERRFNPFVGG